MFLVIDVDVGGKKLCSVTCRAMLRTMWSYAAYDVELCSREKGGMLRSMQSMPPASQMQRKITTLFYQFRENPENWVKNDDLLHTL